MAEDEKPKDEPTGKADSAADEAELTDEATEPKDETAGAGDEAATKDEVETADEDEDGEPEGEGDEPEATDESTDKDEKVSDDDSDADADDEDADADEKPAKPSIKIKAPAKPKASLPQAKNIRSPEFTPHGISAGRGSGPRPSALTAAQAKKRRRATTAAVVVGLLAIAGATAFYVTRPGPTIEVTGALGKAPTVKIPKDLVPDNEFKVTEAITGSGPKLAKGDTAYVKFAFYQWAKGTGEKAESVNKKLNSSWEQQGGGQVMPMTVGSTQVKGLDKGLVGHPAGSRLVLQLPPADGFGEQGSQMGLTNKDSVVFVVDIMTVIPKNAEAKGTEKKLDDKKLPKVEAGEPGKGPKITIPKEDAPKKLQVKTLIEGTGPALAKNDQALVQYVGKLWRDGKTFDESWSKGQPAAFPIGTGGTVPGFDKGLTGVKVGSRVLLVLPPEEGYGKQGNAQAGIKGTDTLVFVVDILGTLPK
ncbi:FKBP-type peptidyl-prolyl cis-trans isomerase [Spirillospora sp. NPDC047279]|uniref:FKBP-type peptidyl-prolyl cis-trans isomerase n=1 Tax=Spirillospora sp. NPDC047279 TaxID=3155478 RepID=UPI0033CC50A7